jgi:hypothetical protein
MKYILIEANELEVLKKISNKLSQRSGYEDYNAVVFNIDKRYNENESKIDVSSFTEPKAFEIINSTFGREFIFMNNWEAFFNLVKSRFSLTIGQTQYLLNEWYSKEKLLKR